MSNANFADQSEKTKKAVRVYLSRTQLALMATKRDKTPLTAHGCYDASRIQADVEGALSRSPQAGLAARTGEEIGPGLRFLVLDRDPRNGGTFEGLEIPDTWRALSGGDGEHVYLSFPSELVIMRSTLRPGIDVKHRNGYIILPPSIHSSGSRYRWAEGCAPWQIPLAPAPDSILQALTSQIPDSKFERVRRTGAEWTALLTDLGEGARDVNLTKLAGVLFRQLPAELAFYALHSINRTHCSPPLEALQVDKIANSIAGRETNGGALQ